MLRSGNRLLAAAFGLWLALIFVAVAHADVIPPPPPLAAPNCSGGNSVLGYTVPGTALNCGTALSSGSIGNGVVPDIGVYSGLNTISDSGVALSALLRSSNNLSDLGNAATARTNLGLGTFATQNFATPPAIGGTTPAAGNFTTLGATGNFTSNITGSTQCVHANSSGVLSGTGSDCGAGGGGLSGMTPGQVPIAATASTVTSSQATATTGNSVILQTDSSGNEKAPVNTTTGAFSGQITSTVSTGTAPLVIGSTTNVPNLNASLLGGATFAAPGPIGSTTPSTGAFTNLSSSGTVSGTGFSSYLASPPAIGGTTAAAGNFTTLGASGNLTTNVTGSTQCLHANSSGVVSGTGSDCGAGGGGGNMTGSGSTTSGNLIQSNNTGSTLNSATDTGIAASSVVNAVGTANTLSISGHSISSIATTADCTSGTGSCTAGAIVAGLNGDVIGVGNHTYTIAQAGVGSFAAGWTVSVINTGTSGNATINATTSNFTGIGTTPGTTLTLAPGASVTLVADTTSTGCTTNGCWDAALANNYLQGANTTFTNSNGATTIAATAPVTFVGTTAGTANAQTIASPTPSGWTNTDQYLVAFKVGAGLGNTAATTLAVSGQTAEPIERQTDSGLVTMTGGELVAGAEYLAQYQTACTCFVLQTQLLASNAIGATSQTITQAQWAWNDYFVVTSASQTLTLPLSTTLSAKGGIVVLGVGVSVTIAPNASDSINGGTAGASVTLPANTIATLSTDAANHIQVPLGLTAGSNITLTPNANGTTTIAASGGGSGISVTDGTTTVNPTTSLTFGKGFAVSGSTPSATTNRFNSINVRSTATYTIASTDMGGEVDSTFSGAVTWTLPDTTTTGFGNGNAFTACAGSGSTVTFANSGGGTATINGSAMSSTSIQPLQCAEISTDATNNNYKAQFYSSSSKIVTASGAITNGTMAVWASGTTIAGTQAIGTTGNSTGVLTDSGGHIDASILPSTNNYAASNPNPTATNWKNCIQYLFTTALNTLTLPAASGLATNGCIVLQTQNVTATVAPNGTPGTDTINGGAAGASLAIPAGLTTIITTNGTNAFSIPIGPALPLSITIGPGINPNDYPIANITTPRVIVGLRCTPEVAVGAAAVVSFMKAPSGTQITAGTDLGGGSTCNANTGAFTDQDVTPTVTTLAAGDRLGLKSTSTGTNWTGGSGLGVYTVFVR